MTYRVIVACCLLAAMPGVRLAQGDSAKRAAGWAYWENTRRASAVLVGTVSDVKPGGDVTISVEQVLKGESLPPVVTFCGPPVLASRGSAPVRISTGRPIHRFQVGDQWLVFLTGDGNLGYSFLEGAKTQVPTFVQMVKDVIAFDSLVDESTKVKFLVDLALVGGIRALQGGGELNKRNRPEYLELLDPLKGSQLHVLLLGRNNNPAATQRLREYLATEDLGLLSETLVSLRGKEPQSNDLSKELLTFVRHADPRIRERALFVLNYRDYWEASPDAARALDDPDARVRSTALCWPWRPSCDDDVRSKIRALARDSDAQVRAAACRTLVSIRDIRSFYFLWGRMLFDPARTVRSEIALDVLFQRCPLRVFAMTFGPSVLLALLFLSLSRWTWRSRIRFLLAVLSIAYPLGVLAGYCLMHNWIFGGFFLMPGITVPITFVVAWLLGLLIVRRRPGRAWWSFFSRLQTTEHEIQ